MDSYIVGNNNSGKTKRLLECARDKNSIVICKNPYAMSEKAKSYGIFGLRFAKYDEIFARNLEDDNVVIDEIANFFEYCCGVKLDSFTMTVD